MNKNFEKKKTNRRILNEPWPVKGSFTFIKIQQRSLLEQKHKKEKSRYIVVYSETQ